MFEKILVAVDGSTNSDRAVAAAAEVARAHGSALNICHAFHIPDRYKADLADELEDVLEGDAAKILSYAVGVAQKAGVEAETRLLEKGHPAEAVIAYAGELGANLIVVGVKGKTADQAKAMGSVSAEITKQASCSVLLVRGG